MNELVSWVASEACRNLVAALMHTLWQGGLIAMALYAYLRATTAQAANRRYLASIMAMGSIVLCGLLTWSILNYEPTATAPIAVEERASHTSATRERVEPETTEGPRSAAAKNRQSAFAGQRKITAGGKSATAPSGSWQIWAAMVWIVGTVAMLLRALLVMVGGRRLRKRCVLAEDERLLTTVEHLRRKMHLRRKIRVVVGEHIAVPGVVGCFWPTLLVPASMATGIPADDLQAILTHELAHIRRFDYLVNFLQVVVEALLFFNQAVWWVSRQIRIEREACCDAAGVLATGHKTRYAQVLVSWAQKMRDNRLAATAAMVGLAEEPGDGRTLDRVKRIMVAGHKPRLRVSWPIAGLMLVLSIACLAALWQGTDLAVAFAGRILTPQERIEKLEEISQEYGFEDRDYGAEDKIHISGTVRTHDGGPLGKHPNALVNSQRPRYGSSASISIQTKNQPQGTGTFDHKAEYGQIYIMATADGYAPAMAGPFDPEPGERIEGIEMVLGEGFTGRIQVLDESGGPVEGAELVGGYTYPNDGSYHHTIKLTTDANGMAIEEHAWDYKVGMQIEADGFEPERLSEVLFKRGETRVVTLKAVEPATGIVVSSESGKPIEGAEVRVMMSRTDDSHTWGEDGMYGGPEAVTDSRGRFALSKLKTEREYLILVRAEGYGFEYVSGIRPGKSDIEVSLGPKRTIIGTITGQLDRLHTNKEGIPIISYRNRYGFEHHESTSSSDESPVRIEDGVGYFEIEEFYGQRISIHAGGKRVSIDTDSDNLENVVIDLQPVNELMREVVLVFEVPDDSPAMQGGVRIDHVMEGENGYKPDWIDIVDSVATCEVRVPCRFKYRVDYYHGKRPVGYWFKEPEDINIPTGEQPFVIDVPVHPAGAIYGSILYPNGRVATDASGSLLVAKKPEIAGKGLNGLNAALHGGGMNRGKFNATPLPLGGRYAIVAYDGYHFELSDTFELDERNQIVEQDIRFGQGVTLEGRLLDIDGSPARDSLRLGVSVKCGQANWSTKRPAIRPDVNGEFTFENVNPNFAGKYILEAAVRPGYRPVRVEVEDVTKPLVIQLEEGKRLRGVVIDDATGRPVPGAEVYASYWEEENGKSRNYERLKAESRTNERGEFVFSNMAEREYRLGVQEANLAGRYDVKGTGGQEEPVTLRIDIYEWSDLKPVKPQED
mgnify:CR=1 FL=1